MSESSERQGATACTARGRRSRWQVALVSLLLLAWLFPGTLGRDPWKADEGYTFGLVLHILQTGDWVIPTLAGEPFMQKPPLLFDLSALAAKLLAPILPLHDGARGSVLLFNLITLVALGLAARRCWGAGQGWLAPVLFIGAPGLIHTQHMMITDVALVSGFAVAQLGLVLSREHPLGGGFLAGTGIGIAFMAKGLLGPGLIGVTVLLLPVLFKSWRSLDYLRMLIALGVAFLPWAILWPALVYERSPDLFMEWFWNQNVARFIGRSTVIDSKNNLLFCLRTVSWFTLPALPLALWGWWDRRKRRTFTPADQITLVLFATMCVVFSISRQARTIYASPMVVPVALAGVAMVDRLPVRWARRSNVALKLLFGLVVVVAWVGWVLMVTQLLAAVDEQVTALVPEYTPRFEWIRFLPALVATVAVGIWWLRQDRRSGRVAVLNWASGLFLVYTLGMTLFLPLANGRMTYRQVFIPLRDHLPPAGEVVASYGVGESERALLHYLAGLKTRRVEVFPDAIQHADWVLIQGDYRRDERMGPPEPGDWTLRFEGRRSRSESYRLYERVK